MIRFTYLKDIELQFRIHTICGILGPRQVGKTTLAKMFVEQHYAHNARFFDLENPLDLALLENPMLLFATINETLIVIDEIQMRPDLFPILRVWVDRPENKHRFLILGSASRDLIRQSSETLAGRIGYIELPPFSIAEVKESKILWMRGGFPRSYLANNDQESMLWRQNYITNFLQRDIPSLGFNIPPEQMRRFWLMLVHYHGQTFNASEIGKSLGISDHTARRYLDILAGTFMIRILVPWFENLSRRQVKLPKIYFRDSGILHALLNINTMTELQTYPRLGSFWEGFALEQVARALQATPDECFFWGIHESTELDFMIFKNGKRIGFEFKYTDRPSVTKSMHSAMKELKLDHLALIYPGNIVFPLDTNITAYGLDSIITGEFLKGIID